MIVEIGKHIFRQDSIIGAEVLEITPEADFIVEDQDYGNYSGDKVHVAQVKVEFQVNLFLQKTIVKGIQGEVLVKFVSARPHFFFTKGTEEPFREAIKDSLKAENLQGFCRDIGKYIMGLKKEIEIKVEGASNE